MKICTDKFLSRLGVDLDTLKTCNDNYYNPDDFEEPKSDLFT